MTLRFPLIVAACLAFVVAAPIESSGAELANPVPALREELKKQHDAAVVSLDAVAAIVDAEEKAQRLNPDSAAKQRRRISELRGHLDGMISSSTTVTEAQAGAAAGALSRAWQSFDDGVVERRASRVKATERAKEETLRYALDVWRSAETPDSLAPPIEALRAVAKENSPESPRPGYNLPDSVLGLLVSSQRFLEALAREDARAISSALNMMNSGNPRGDRSVSATEVDQWTGRFAKRFADELKALRRAADELVVKKAPSSELQVMADKVDSTIGKLRALSGERSMTSWERSNSEPNIYRPWAALVRAVEEGQWTVAEQLDAKLQLSPEQLSAAALKVMVDTRIEIQQHKTKELVAARTSAAEAVRKRVATVSDAASALKLADELRAERMSRPADAAEVNLLENELRQLAAFWSSESVRLPLSRVPDFETTRAWSVDLAALRTRAFREAVARMLQVPELLLPPLSALPPEQAVRQVARENFAKGEWLRLHTILSASNAIFERSGLPENEDLRALKSFLTGQNLERAEQFSDAATAYRSVLNCIGEFVPVDAAADRLKALKREHPDLFKERAASSPSGGTIPFEAARPGL